MAPLLRSRKEFRIRAGFEDKRDGGDFSLVLPYLPPYGWFNMFSCILPPGLKLPSPGLRIFRRVVH